MTSGSSPIGGAVNYLEKGAWATPVLIEPFGHLLGLFLHRDPILGGRVR